MTARAQSGELSAVLVEEAVHRALCEDLGLAGDITTDATVPVDEKSEAAIVARAPGTVAGLGLAEATFRAVDPAIEFAATVVDGDRVSAEATLANLTGGARSILTGERVALNFLNHMSGIATLTRAYVDAVTGTAARICCTRKTLAGLRSLQKYAVRMGGGVNHRFGLFDAILIKDNHIAHCGDVGEAISRARARSGHMVRIEVEVDTIEQLREALDHDIDAVLLDNMSTEELARCVALAEGRVLTEASGGVSLENVGAIALSGVDMISIGALTHSAPALDIGLDFAPSSA